MTGQLGFSDLVAGRRPPRARRADHDSSHQAADQVEASGLAEAQMHAARAAVAAHPGSSSADLARRSYYAAQDAGVTSSPAHWRTALGRRLPELEDRGAVVATKPTGKPLRWWPPDHVRPADAGPVRQRAAGARGGA